jgi:Tol biopolymer transport system component
LWLRSLGSVSSRPLEGTDGASCPFWSPNGTQIVFAAIAKKVTDLFRMSVKGGKAELLLETDQPKAATDWSTDGRFLLYRCVDRKTGWDIWALPMDRGGSPGARVQVVRTNFDETNGHAHGLDGLWGMYQWLHRDPKGRNETGVW